MTLLHVVLALALVAGITATTMGNGADAQMVSGKNICPNPSFEMLSPIGDRFPLNWSAGKIGNGEASVSIDTDAFEGGTSVRLKAKADGLPTLNSDLIDVRSGTVTFRYKVVASGAEGRNLLVYLIAMSPGMTEITRVGYAVPKENTDGKWHQGSIDFFFPQPNCAGILICPRVNENSDHELGEWLIDDIVCIAKKFGAKATIEALYMPEKVLTLGKASPLVIQIANAGDDDLVNAKMRLTLPEGLKVIGDTSTELAVDKIKPGDWRRIEWQIEATKCGEYDISAELQSNIPTVTRTRHTVCVKKIVERELYTGPDGFFRMMPKLATMQEGNSSPISILKTKKSSELPENFCGITAHLPRSKDLERIFEGDSLIDGKANTNWSGRAHATSVPGSVDWVEITFPEKHKLKQVRLLPYWKTEGFPVDFVIKVKNGKKWSVVHEAKAVMIPAADGEGKKKPYVIGMPAGVETDAIRLEVTRFSMASGFFCDLGPSNY
ncbi:MAG: discoidin domain-containing protein, partial [Armatimonadota bacterium]